MRTKGRWLKNRQGWLQNKARRDRRDRPGCFTDEDVMNLIRKIEVYPHYITPHLSRSNQGLEESLKLRDKALIALTWIFFKRAGESLKLKRKHVSFSQKYLLATFTVQKKRKRFKICEKCGTKNGVSNKFCRGCSQNLSETPIIVEGKPKIVTKRKRKDHTFVKFVSDWIEKLEEIGPKNPEYYIFAPVRVRFSSAHFDFSSPMKIENFDRILHRLDKTISSCFFRYGGAEKHLLLGFTPRQLKVIGDWSTSTMPERYAERRGLTPEERQWADDAR